MSDEDAVEVYSLRWHRDDAGNLVVYENEELVTDEARAVELYARFGGTIGWPIMDMIEEAQRQ